MFTIGMGKKVTVIGIDRKDQSRIDEMFDNFRLALILINARRKLLDYSKITVQWLSLF